MKLDKWNILWGVLMVVAGSLVLLESLGVLAVGGPIWSVLFGVAGVGFLYGLLASRENSWAAIPAGALLGIVALIASSELAPGFAADDWGASLF